MVTQNVCSYLKYEFCKHGDVCQNYHERRICDKNACDILRHPKICRYFETYKRCKFDPCAYKHEDNDKAIKAISEKLEQLSIKIKILDEKEKESEKMIEKLKHIDDMAKKKDDKIQILENNIKDANLKICEQSKEIDLINKKLRSLKERDNKVKNFEADFEILVKKVDDIIAPSNETNSEIHVTYDMSEDGKNKCQKCDFIAKNEHGLKIHIKAKHTEPSKEKKEEFFKFDFNLV